MLCKVASFALVSLVATLFVACSAPTEPTDVAADESAVGATPNLYGFTAGARVAQEGIGDIEQNVGPSWRCRRKTTRRLKCGGWISASVEGGKTVVRLGVMAHDGYYSAVSGRNGADA